MREYSLDYTCRKLGEHTGETCQYSGQKVHLDDEQLLTLNTTGSFAVPFKNQNLEITFVLIKRPTQPRISFHMDSLRLFYC